MQSNDSSLKSRNSTLLTYIVIGGILFISGFCSLAYQVVWLREFRLLFGGATPAASAVLAVFMGGLGIGGAWLGAKVEKSRYPGRFYAIVEAGITFAAVISPLLFMLVQSLYIRTGGIQTLGLPLATVVQICMTALVIGPSCFLMGGTLPAALKYAQSDEDVSRSTTAFYYGINVCGAVSGAFLATFVMLPAGGNLLTLFTAGFANALIAVIAWAFMRQEHEVEPKNKSKSNESEPEQRVQNNDLVTPRWFIYTAAFTSGFVFFLIELVWFRASIPLFGGSVYNFGLILTVALAGIGVGSLFYSLFIRRFRPSLAGFAIVSSLLAFCIILPFMLGDYLAHFALLLNNFFRPRSFESLVFGWGVISFIMVFLPAVFSGIQFPLLISLLGRGNQGIGREIGHTYAWNTLGAVLGSLAGGFILITKLSVSGCWRLAAITAVFLSIGSLVLGWKAKARSKNTTGGWVSGFAAVSGGSVLAITLIASGPSSYWYHHPIGYGRGNALFGSSYADWVNYVRDINRDTIKSIDGRETTISLHSSNEYAFFSNGKSDSSALSDAGTTVMIGMAGVALHPTEAKEVCVVGLATGITVGWLTQVEEVESIDVFELESASKELSRAFKAVNFSAADHQKTHFIQGDAREFFSTHSSKKYDLIISEPSNIHRAGVANLYTQEFYESVAKRMNPDGLFNQWVQTYETDLESIHLVISTLRSVFPKVELWQTLNGDLLLVCSLTDGPWNYDLVKKKLGNYPLREASLKTWGTATPEGFFARIIGNSAASTRIAVEATVVNTDDHNLLEFAFGRRVGVGREPVMDILVKAAQQNREVLPALQMSESRFDSEKWAAESLWKSVIFSNAPVLPAPPEGKEWSESLHSQFKFLNRRAKMSPKEQVDAWPKEAKTEMAIVAFARQLALAGEPSFIQAVEDIRTNWPIEAVILEGVYAEKTNRTLEAMEYYFKAIEMTHTDPWVRTVAFRDALNRTVNHLRKPTPEMITRFPKWFEIATIPISFSGLTDDQRSIQFFLSRSMSVDYQVRAAESWGEHFPWTEDLLRFRAEAYRQVNHVQSAHATREFETFLRQSGRQLDAPAPDNLPTTEK